MRLAKNESDARTHRTPKALHAKRWNALSSTRWLINCGSAAGYLAPLARSRNRLQEKPIHLPTSPSAPTSGLFPIASLPRLFRGVRRSVGSGEAVAGIFAGSDGGFYACPASTPDRVVLLRQSSIAGRFPPVEALHSGPATSECDSLPLAVALRSHCSLLPPPPVDVGLPPAGFDMRRSLQLARWSMCWPFADHNESVLELPSAVRRSKLSTFLISS